MHISKQDYNQIMLDYKDSILVHEAELNAKREKIYSENPKLMDMEYELKKLKLNKIKLSIKDGDDTINDKKIALLSGEIDKVLSKYKLTKETFNGAPLCAKCNDTGYIGNEMCTCLKKFVIDYSYKNSNLKDKFKKENFDTFNLDFYPTEKLNNMPLSSYQNAQIIYGACRDYCNNFSKMLDKNYNDKFNLLFYGAPGLGKTFMCNSIAKDILDRCYQVVYYSSCELSKLILQNAFNNKNNDDDDLDISVKNVYDCDLLILDDLGTEANNQIFVSELFNIINTRLNSHKPTIISTNLDMSDLREKYTERISSRFIEGYEIFKFFGKNIRELKNN